MPGEFCFVRCRACGHLYLNPRPAPGDLPAIYPADYYAYSDAGNPLARWLRRLREARKVRIFRDAIGDGPRRILDLGCGNGRLLAMLREHGSAGWDLEGIDFSEDAVRHCREKGFRAQATRIEDFDAAAGSFDAVIMIQLIEHLEDPRGIFERVHALLRPGGVFILETPNVGGLDYRWFRGRWWGMYHFPRHWNLFSTAALRRLLSDAGFTALRADYLISTSSWILSLHNLLLDRGWPQWLVRCFHFQNARPATAVRVDRSRADAARLRYVGPARDRAEAQLRSWSETLPGEDTTLRVPPTNQRFELFESLRAIAALSVLVFHTAGWSGVNLFTWYGAFTSKLHVGVTLFFLISGFLLYRPHAVEMLGGPAAPHAGDYALRRAFRILPAYWVALTVLGLWPGLSGVFTKNWWVYYGLLQSYRQNWSMRGIGVAWSLSVEMAFYVLLPLLAMALSRAGRRLDPRGRMRLQLLAFAALGVGSLIFRAAIHSAGLPGLYTSLPANLLGFLAGMALAVVSTWFEGREREWWAARWIVAHPGLCWALAAVLFTAISLSPALPAPVLRCRAIHLRVHRREPDLHVHCLLRDAAGGLRGACRGPAAARASKSRAFVDREGLVRNLPLASPAPRSAARSLRLPSPSPDGTGVRRSRAADRPAGARPRLAELALDRGARAARRALAGWARDLRGHRSPEHGRARDLTPSHGRLRTRASRTSTRCARSPWWRFSSITSPTTSGAQYGAWYSAFSARLGVGVTLFFLISGFLLYRPYAVSMLGGPPALSARVYASRRALRILPAYWLALTLLGVWPGLPGVFESEWWGLYGLLQSYSLDWLFKGIPPAWSLSVEAAFYVMLPFFALALARAGRRLDRGRRLRLQLVTLAGFGAFGLGYRAFTFHRHSLVLLGTTLPAFLLWFAVGMSVAVVSAWYEGREREWGPTRWLATHSGWCWAIAWACWWGCRSRTCSRARSPRSPIRWLRISASTILYALVALLVMLPAVFGEREGGLPRRLMGTRAFRWLGRISYGLFLWHAPLLSAFQVARLVQADPQHALPLTHSARRAGGDRVRVGQLAARGATRASARARASLGSGAC